LEAFQGAMMEMIDNLVSMTSLSSQRLRRNDSLFSVLFLYFTTPFKTLLGGERFGLFE